MKYLLLLISFNCLASDEFNVSFLRINQVLKFSEPIHFKMDAVQLGYTYWHDSGLGFKLNVARSTDTPNAFYIGKDYRNKINALWQGQITYKYDVNDKFSLISCIGITEYHSTWKVDGIEPSWSKGTDSHKPSYCVGFQYDIEPRVKIEAMYSYMYFKDKENYGEEVTYAFGAGLTYSF